MDCQMCHAYVYDALRNPILLPGTNALRAAKHARLFTPEFIRAGHMNTDTEFVSLLFVEVGGVSRSCFTRNPAAVARTWVRHQQKAMGNISEIHNQHACVPRKAERGLRIRIPPEEDDDGLYA